MKTGILLSFLLLLVSEGMSKLSSKPIIDPDYDAARSKTIAMGVFDVTQKLIKQSVLISTAQHFYVMSPISISSILHLIFLGSRGNSFDQIVNL